MTFAALSDSGKCGGLPAAAGNPTPLPLWCGGEAAALRANRASRHMAFMALPPSLGEPLLGAEGLAVSALGGAGADLPHVIMCCGGVLCVSGGGGGQYVWGGEGGGQYVWGGGRGSRRRTGGEPGDTPFLVPLPPSTRAKGLHRACGAGLWTKTRRTGLPSEALGGHWSGLCLPHKHRG